MHGTSKEMMMFCETRPNDKMVFEVTIYNDKGEHATVERTSHLIICENGNIRVVLHGIDLSELKFKTC